MAHLHTGPGGHDTTVSALVFMEDPARLLVHFHRKLDVWLQPGGHVEHDENPWQAVIRELREEAGYEIDQLEVLHPFTPVQGLEHDNQHPTPAILNTHEIGGSGHWHSDLSFVFVAASEPRHAPAEGESTQLRWVEIAGIDEAQVTPDLAKIAKAVAANVLPSWIRVPAVDWSLETWRGR